MPPDRDPLAAELAGIRDRASQITHDHDVAECIADLGGPCSGHDAERLADVVEAALDAAARWKRQSTTGYAAAAQCAEELERVAARELLSEGEDDG
jgi:hypothetical protein